MSLAILSDESGFAITGLKTPAKNALILPSQALADAIASEWKQHEKFSPTKMPMTALAYTAIDRIALQMDSMAEAMLVYLDTDTLSYRAEKEDTLLLARQQKNWDPVVAWFSKKFGVEMQVTSGIMPMDQSPQLHAAVKKYVQGLSPMHLAAFGVLASLYSSLVLAIAVVDRHLDAMDAFALSRLEEEAQNERWGRDEEAGKSSKRIEEETRSVSSFLNALDSKLDGAMIRH